MVTKETFGFVPQLAIKAMGADLIFFGAVPLNGRMYGAKKIPDITA